MKQQKNFKWSLILFCLFLISFSGCKDENGETLDNYDPNLPVTITSFTPESGGAKTQLIIYGSNFGNDPTKVKVKVGGIEAIVLSTKGDCLYCLVPEKGNGKVEVTVEDGTPVISEKDFKYEFKRVVSTLCGYVDELGYGSIVSEGSFDELEKIDCPAWLTFDPLDKNILYCAQDAGYVSNNKALLRFDLKNRYMNTVIKCNNNTIRRMLTIDWDKENNMVVSTPNPTNNSTTIGGVLLKRSEGFAKFNTLVNMVQCISMIYNEDANKIYYGDYNYGRFYSYDYNDLLTNGFKVDNQENLFQFTGSKALRFFVKHPELNYVYIIAANPGNAILRTDYNTETEEYSTPYLVCGGNGAGYADLVGVNAKLNNPWQGCFVKNPEYVKEGKLDKYDFYFVDRENHCVRKLTPDGVVSTFAGRGSRNLNARYDGYVDGDLREDARFKQPQGIAYDEERDVFYISDMGNYRIRMISYEDGGATNVDVEGSSDDNTETDK